MTLRLIGVGMWVVSAMVLAGCMPKSEPPQVTGPLDTTAASKLQGRIRIDQGDRYDVTHQFKGTDYVAHWELGNAMKKSSLLQIKPPVEWSDAEVYQALVVVLEAHETKPWYSQIDDTVLSLFRAALEDDNNFVTGTAPETPYSLAVKVKQHTSEWFVEVRVQILDENGMALGI